MGAQRAPAIAVDTGERRLTAQARSRWLLLARAVWITLLGFALANLVVSLPIYVAQLQTPCSGGACEYQQLTPAQIKALDGIGLSLEGYAAVTVTLLFIGLTICWGLSALIVWQRPDDRMAFLVALLLVTLGPLGASTTLPSDPSPWRSPHNYMISLFIVLFVFVFLLFPSGRFVPRWMRWVFVALVVAQLSTFLITDLPLLPDAPWTQFGWLVALVEMATVAVVQLYRYRWVSSPLERQQTKWVMFGLALPIAALIGVTIVALVFPALGESSAFYALAFNELEFLLLILLPLSIGIAMLRYRLWDIDVIINRTLVYGSMTAILGLLYAGGVIGLQALVNRLTPSQGAEDSPVVIVITTLMIAALFLPLRRRLQGLIDRRFFRRKYNATRTLTQFGEALRSRAELETLADDLISVVDDAMQPAHVSLWLRPQQPSPAPDFPA